MYQALLKRIAILLSRLYFSKKEYAEPIYHFLSRIGITGIIKETLSHLSFLLALEKCIVVPRIVRFETSSLCNLKCPMCPQPNQMTRKKTFMDFALYQKVIDSNPQIKEVELFNWGEPLMNPKISDFVRYASNRRILTRFVTNATLLNKEKSKQLIDSGINEIYFSLDNIGDEYRKIRNYQFEQVIENISTFISLCKKQERKIRTGINIVKSKYNKDGIDKALAYLTNLGIDFVSVEECQFENQNIERTSRCFEPYRNITILSNGEVVPCCVDYDGELSMGNARKENKLKKIFNNHAYRIFRKSFKSANRMHLICRKCSYRSITFNF